jgi:hypothetical protein
MQIECDIKKNHSIDNQKVKRKLKVGPVLNKSPRHEDVLGE